MKKLAIFTYFILFAMFLNAQVNLEISNGMTIETTGGLAVEVSGNLVENGTGYLKGTVTSGNRSGGISSFAGLTITGGSVSQITRNTGQDFNGSAAPLTTLRNYEVVSPSAFTADVSSNFVNSGINDETNGVGDKYIFKELSNTWTGYSDNGSTPTSITGSDVQIPSGTSNIVISEGVGIGATIFLEGPYNSTAHNLNNSIHASIPTTSPYSEASRTTTIPTQAVDWVLLELRSGTAPSSSLGFRSAFVDANGNIIDDSGNPGIGFPAAPGTGQRLVVKHRNHLAVMSSGTFTTNWLSVP